VKKLFSSLSQVLSRRTDLDKFVCLKMQLFAKWRSGYPDSWRMQQELQMCFLSL